MLSVFWQTAYAVPFTFDARSLGMGGTSTATADLANAAWSNPAMLTNQRIDDNFSVLIGFGAFVRDDDNLIGDVDDFQDADDRRKAAQDAGNLEAEARAVLDMYSIVNGIESKMIAPEATALIAMGKAFESFAMAFSVRADAIAGGVVADLSCDLTKRGCDPYEILSDEYNILNIDGVMATEFGVSFARDFKLWDRKVSIGVKPKVVELDAFSESEAILTINEDDDFAIDQENRQDLGAFSTVDLGMAIELSDSVRLGLNVRNLVTDKFDLFDQTLNFDTEARIGVAYHNNSVTIAADFDLTENEPLLPNDSFGGLRKQELVVGAEFNSFDYLKFRLGVSKNMASDISSGASNPTYTAGIGLWLGFNLDIAAIVNDHSLGAVLQAGFRF
ncbi:MAG: conjugal transfer protein TraF [Gammaproteobacteria bacterium]|nr:conjugal transfer protein TraF [Gammaproteobacteria bacterium]